MKHILLVILTLAAAVVFSGRTAWSQSEAGTIAGTVSDKTGAVIPNASVTAKSASTGAERTVASGPTGQYIIPGLIPGFYDVTVTSGNFAAFKARAEVTVGGRVTVDAQLSVSGQTTTVEVVGEGGTAVNTQTQEISQLVNAQELSELPSLTRNAYDFVAISGNISNGDSTSNSSTTTASGGGQSLTSRGVGYSLNGQRESGTEILLDGVENVSIFSLTIGQQVPIDAIQEYSVITNNFSPEYGRASGGVLNASSKSGTNDIHGSAWEFNRLSDYTSNTFSNNATDVPRGVYTRNQFGFAAGGPIVKNKLFVFESTEWTRVRSSASETEEILDPSFISMLPTNIQNYFTQYGTGAPAAASTITAGQLAAAGLTVGPINGTTAVPATQPVFDVVNFKAPFDAGGDVPQNTYSLLGRADYNFSDTTQLFFRVGMDSLDEFPGSSFYTPYSQYDVGFSQYDQSYLVSLNHTFTPNVLNSAKVSFTRFDDKNSFNTALTSTPNLYLASASPADPINGNLIQLPGLENIGVASGGLPYGGPQNTLQLEDDLTWTKGKHTMKFGGQFTYIQLNVAYGAYAQAVEELGGGLQTGMNGLVNTYANPGGSPLISFVARVNSNGALPCNATPAFWATQASTDLISSPSCEVTPPLSPADYARSYRYKDWALYAADSFRMTRRLTLNYGLRYEHYGTQHNNHQDLDSNFYLGSGAGLYEQVQNGQVFPTQQSPVGQFWAPRWGTAAPRVGFAFDVFGDGKTSLRGGYGISYERNFGNVTFNASFNPPSSAVINSICDPATLASCSILATNNGLGPLGVPGPPSLLPPAELRMPNPNINVAQTQFWSLSLQHQLARNTMVDVSYSGAHGVHLYDIENINLLGTGNLYLNENPTDPACDGPVDPTTGNPICYTRANSQYSNINERGSLGSSSYNALNVKFQTQNLHNTGLTMVVNYTWSHSLDDLSSTFSDTLGPTYVGSLGYTNVLDPKLDWGNSDFNVGNRIAASPLWVTPWFNSGSGLERQVLGGYTISGIITARSGIPFSVYDASYELNYYTVPRLTPDTAITQYHVGAAQSTSSPSVFNVLNVPVPAPLGPNNPTLGISDFGPYPADMTRRNAFTGPGAWNTSLALTKSFRLSERFSMNFRAELFNAFNHANLYVNTTNLSYGYSAILQGAGATMASGGTEVTGLKGGLGSLASGGNHDERRFGQFALQLMF
jgi:hypothetical protein